MRLLSSVDPARTAVVEAELTEAREMPPPDTAGALTLLEWTPEYLRYEVEAAEPAVLVVFERFSEGWQARVDGSPTEVFPSNSLFRGVYLPAGRHQVEMFYQPLSFRLGLFVSAIGLLALMAGAWRLRQPAEEGRPESKNLIEA